MTLRGDYDFLLYNNGGIYTLISGATGIVVSTSNTDAAIPLNYGLTNLSPTNGGKIVVAQGIYNTFQTINIAYGSTSIEGFAASEPLYASSFYKQFSGHFLQSNGGLTTRREVVSIKNINVVNQSNYTGDCFHFENTDSIDISKCFIRNFLHGRGIYLKTVYVCWIDRCSFTFCGDFTNQYSTVEITADTGYSSTDTYVMNSVFEVDYYASIKVMNCESPIYFINNYAEQTVANTHPYYIIANSPMIIQGNYLLGCTVDAILLNSAYCSVIGNTIKGVGSGGSDSYAIRDTSGYNSIEDNIIKDHAGASAIRTYYYTIVCNNSIYFAYSGILIAGLLGIVNGNKLYVEGTNNGTSIDVGNGASNNIINGNIIEDRSTATIRNGIFILASSLNNNVCNNVIWGTNFSTVINVIPSNNSIIRNNTGFATDNVGIATIPILNTSIVVAHGLGHTPSVVNCSGSSSDTAGIWISNITATSFTANVNAPVQAARTISWRAAL